MRLLVVAGPLGVERPVAVEDETLVQHDEQPAGLAVATDASMYAARALGFMWVPSLASR